MGFDITSVSWTSVSFVVEVIVLAYIVLLQCYILTSNRLLVQPNVLVDRPALRWGISGQNHCEAEAQQHSGRPGLWH